MPLPGGATDKIGNRYENIWTVCCMAEVMAERALSLRLEPPGDIGKGIEFWLRRQDGLEYHQVKRQNTAGHWSLAELDSREVLKNFKAKLSEAEASCIFVSSHAASQLQELGDRARGASSWLEFEKDFLKAREPHAHFYDLYSRWGDIHHENAFKYLQRIHVRTIDERSLRELVENQIKVLVDSDPETVADVLAEFALTKVHNELTAHDIWDHLETRGFHRRQWANDPHVLAAVSTANDMYLTPLTGTAIIGEIIPRNEVTAIVEKLTSKAEKSGILVAGSAGLGKSMIILQTVKEIRELGWPILAFRVDRRDPTDFPDELGRQLQLPSSPATVLAAIAQEHDCLLVIDQLDAVSLASGRNPQFFDCISAIIRQARSYPGMRVLLACRQFDLENDHRLRALVDTKGIAESVAVSALPRETVVDVVKKLGLDPTGLNENKMQLLSIPLHLSILAEIAKDSKGFDFETSNDLFKRFWDYKEALLSSRVGHSIHFAQVIDALCGYMSDNQVLSVPEAVVDTYGQDAKTMASEHVLAHDANRYAFFHESFFDYAFARRFTVSGQDLLSLLKSSEQHLFRRAQVRQILLHERDIDRVAYIRDLEALLMETEIRFHIKESVLSLLREVAEPIKEEWRLIAISLEEQDSPLGRKVWHTIYGSVAWFNLLDSLGVIKEWMASDKETMVNMAITLQSSVLPQAAGRIAEIIEPFIGRSEEWNNRIGNVFYWSKPGVDRRFFELLLRLIDVGIIGKKKEAAGGYDNFWHMLDRIGRENPNWMCEALALLLNRNLEQGIECGQPNPFQETSLLLRDHLGARSIRASALSAPKAFLSHLLPVVLRIVGLNTEQTEELPWYDDIWSYRSYPGDDIASALLGGLQTALSKLAENEPDAFSVSEADLSSLDYATVQRLLLRAFTANAARFADRAVEYICDKPSRLETKRSGDYIIPVKLLEAVTPHCSDESINKLEKVLLRYYPKWEKSADGHRDFGHAQLLLLSAIVPDRRSNTVARRLAELHRKFGEIPVETDHSSLAPPVLSPLPESAVDKMSDAQWLKAIVKYNDEREFNRRAGRFIGGAFELSRMLEQQATKQPKRFALLILRFPSDTHHSYVSAVLSGITGKDVEIPLLTEVCRYCHKIENHPFGDYICRLVAKLAHQDIPDELLDIVVWYATEHPNPERELWQAETPGDTVYHSGDILTCGMNSTRGSAAQALTKLISYNGEQIPYLLPILKRMVCDPSISVKACVADTLIAVLKHNRQLAIDLFIELCETEDVLLQTEYVEHFLHYALRTHAVQLTSILQRMINSDINEVVIAGSRQACVSALTVEETHELANLCSRGTEPQRLGAAEVFAVNLRSSQFRSLCEGSLIELFNDPVEQVRDKAADCFTYFEGDEIGEYTKLIETFVVSNAFDANHNHLIHALEKTTAKLPEIVLMVCERFLDTVGSDAANIQSYNSYEASILSKLLIRIYRQSNDTHLQTRCLDLIDRFAKQGAYGLDDAIALYDR